MDNLKESKPRKKGKVGKIILIVLLVFVALIAIIIVAALNSVETTAPDPQAIEDNIDFTSSNWTSAGQKAAKDYLNQYYNGGEALSYDWKYDSVRFVDVDYDYGEDDTYEATDFTYGYYVCEGAFNYDIPGDRKSETVLVSYTTSVFVTDNANDYRFSLRSITLTFDGVEIDSYKNAKFFSE